MNVQGFFLWSASMQLLDFVGFLISFWECPFLLVDKEEESFFFKCLLVELRNLYPQELSIIDAKQLYSYKSRFINASSVTFWDLNNLARVDHWMDVFLVDSYLFFVVTIFFIATIKCHCGHKQCQSSKVFLTEHDKKWPIKFVLLDSKELIELRIVYSHFSSDRFFHMLFQLQLVHCLTGDQEASISLAISESPKLYLGICIIQHTFSNSDLLKNSFPVENDAVKANIFTVLLRKEIFEGKDTWLNDPKELRS